MIGFRIRFSLALIAVVLTAGTFGYHLIEGWSLFESFYMTVITISTVGYGEIRQLTTGGRILSLGIILVGVTGMAYGVSGLMEDLVENRIRRLLGRRRVEKKIARLHGHVIVCGYGRMGKILCETLVDQGEGLVIIEIKPERAASADEAGCTYVQGDARDEDVLACAGIREARALITVMGSDPDNLSVTLTARGMNESVMVIARCEEPKKQKNFLRAGASKVILPQSIGARHAASLLLHPSAMDFIDIQTESCNLDLIFDEMTVGADSPYGGQTLLESEIHQKTGVMVLAIRRMDGELILNPPPDALLRVGDTLVTVGSKESDMQETGSTA